MRSHKLTGVVTLLVIGSLFGLLIGCSSDTPNSPDPGSLNDPAFMLVQAEVNDFLEANIEYFANGLGSMAALGAGNVDPILYGPGGPATSDTNYYANDWHIINSTWVFAENTFMLWDSVQFRDATGTPLVTSQMISELTFNRHWTDLANNTSGSYRNSEGVSHLEFTNLLSPSTQALVNGTSYWGVYSNTVSVTQGDMISTWDIFSNVNDVAINKGVDGAWSSGTPASGTISAIVTVNTNVGTGQEATREWQIEVTFADGTTSCYVTSGNLFWHWNHQAA